MIDTAYLSTLKINHFSPSKVPWRWLGQYAYRIVEDGSNTQMRLGVIESLIPPHAKGPVVHFHEMHDEGFIVKRGTVRFHSPGRPDVDAKAGDMVIIPTRLPHRFSNPFAEEAEFIGTTTPGHYVRYFEVLEQMIGQGKELTPEVNKAAMLRFATVPLSQEAVDMLEEAEGGLKLAHGKEQTNGIKNGVTSDVANGTTDSAKDGVSKSSTAAQEVNGATNGHGEVEAPKTAITA